MQDFLTEYYTTLTYSVEFLAAFTGLLLFKKYKNSNAKYLIYFLVLAFFIDLIGYYPRVLKNLDLSHLTEGTLLEENYWWYNIFWNLVLTGFLSKVNYNILKKKPYKMLLKYCYFVFIGLFVLYSIFNFESLFSIGSMFLTLMSLWMIFICVSLYFIEILQSEEVIHFYKSIYFYINSIVLLWSIVTGPLIFYEVYYEELDMNFVILKWQIFLLTNIFFYLTLTVSLIWCKKQVR